MALRSMSNDLWRWADPDGQQRRVRLDELRAALAGGHIAPNTPVWRSGWKAWQSAHEVPELTSSALSAANGVVPNIPPPPLAMVAMQHEFESKAGASFRPPPVVGPGVPGEDEPPPPPHFVPLPVKANSIPPGAPGSSGRLSSLAPPAPGSAPGSSPGSPSSAQRAGQGHALPTTIGLPPPPELAAIAAGQPAQAGLAGQVAPGAVKGRKAGSATLLGVAPQGTANGGGAKDPMIEELSGSMLLDDNLGAGAGAMPGSRSPTAGGQGPAPPVMVSQGAPPTNPVMRGGEGAAAPGDGEALDDDVAGLPPRRRPQLTAIFDDFQEMKAGRPPKNKLLIAVVAVVGLSVLISLLALVVSLFRGKPSELPDTTASSASASSTATSTATAATGSPATARTNDVPAPSAPATAAAVTGGKTAASEGSLGDCALAGEAHVVSPRAFVQSGIEAVSVPGAIALGYAVDARNGVGVTVDPASIGITTTVKARALGGDARRMSPVLERGKLLLVAGVDRKGDKLQGRRVVATSPPIDVGVAEGSLVWAPRDVNSYAKLFALEGEGVVDAIRAVPLGAGTKGIAVAFRRGNAVYVGAAKGDAALTAEGSLARITGLGQVGSPSLTVSGDTIIVAWSDRATAQDAWQVRWTKLNVGGAPEPPKQLTMPEGGLGAQAMSPSVAALGGGRFVMAWSEGTPTHQVRAVTLNGDGSASGAAMSLSAAGINAGQPQVAIGPDGRGVVGFLAAKGKAYEIHATPIACPAK